MLMDSPLNRAGLLQVYIHTEKNALIEINPQTRIPRTFTRFCGLMGKLPLLFCFLFIPYMLSGSLCRQSTKQSYLTVLWFHNLSCSISFAFFLTQFSCCTNWVSGRLMVHRNFWGWLKTQCLTTSHLVALESPLLSLQERLSAPALWCQRDQLQWWLEHLHMERWDMTLDGYLLGFRCQITVALISVYSVY